MNKVTVKEIKQSKKVRAFLEKGNDLLGEMGYTDHGLRHSAIVSKTAGEILRQLGFDDRLAELAEIAGYMHDIGNALSRVQHYQTGAILAVNILEEYKMDYDEIATIVSAIGNHDEGMGVITSDVAAALILADKADVHRSRVRNKDKSLFDIHDRVNFSALESTIEIRNSENKTVILNIVIDTEISKVMEYFEIFLTRMIMCRNAAEYLGANFKLFINDNELL
jgi:hypothetical protein